MVDLLIPELATATWRDLQRVADETLPAKYHWIVKHINEREMRRAKGPRTTATKAKVRSAKRLRVYRER